MEDRRCLAWSLAITAIASGLGVLYCLILYGLVQGHPAWWVAPIDADMLTRAGDTLIRGHLGAVYSDDSLYSLPLSFPFAGLVALVVDWLHLAGPAHHDGVVVVVPGFCAMGLPALYQARRLAWDLGIQRRLPALQVATGALLFVPLVEWGHPEDVLAIGFVIAALRRMMRADHVRACVYLSLAVSCKQWAVMLVPLALFGAPRGLRTRCLIAVCAVPAALAAVFLSVDFHDALRAFLDRTTAVDAPGHYSLFGSWLGLHRVQISRTAATILAGGLAWRYRRAATEPAALVTVAAVILLIRPIAEPINYSYYWAPALVLLGLALSAGRQRFTIVDWSWLELSLVWTLHWSNGVASLQWWLGETAILAMVFLTSRRLSARAYRPLAGADPVRGRPQVAEVAR